MKRKLMFSLLALALLTCFSACVPQSNYKQGSYLTGRSLSETAAGEQNLGMQLHVTYDRAIVGVTLRGQTAPGQIYVLLKDQKGQTAWKSGAISGSFTQSMRFETLKSGNYDLYLGWNGPVEGKLDIFTLVGDEVNLPQVTPMAFIPGLGMIAAALVYVFYAVRRGWGWKYLGMGALAWVVAVALKAAFAIAVNSSLYQLVVGSADVVSPQGIIFDVYVGSLTGIFEVLLVWLFVRRSRRVDKTNWQKALAFGVGFGAVEALLLGLVSVIGMLVTALNPGAIPFSSLESLSLTTNLFYDLAPISERIFTILVHIFSCLLIFYAAYKHQQGWMWLAFAYKTLFDAVAAYAQLTGVTASVSALWVIEAIIVVAGLLGGLGCWRLLPAYRQEEAQNAASPDAA